MKNNKIYSEIDAFTDTIVKIEQNNPYSLDSVNMHNFNKKFNDMMAEDMANQISNKINVKIKDKPFWMPNFIYKKFISLLLVQEWEINK